MLEIADVDAPLASYARKVGWNDPDLVLVGNRMTLDENRTQMTLWAMLAAPLISSTDVLHLSSSQLEINPDVIAIDQDSEVQQRQG
jgi:alpha-galactosidase